MSDRLAQLRSLADGVGDLQHGQPGDEDHCTAADVIRWAVAEIERNRMTEEERAGVAWAAREAENWADENDDEHDQTHGERALALRAFLDRTAPEEEGNV